MIVLDLFSGIGGFSLGLDWAGFRTAAFCEADPFCRAVLARHWPGVPCYPDIRTLSAARLRADGVPRPDLLCGGFPCQDISTAGPGGGIDGARSGLWHEMLRLVGECRPGWVVVENVPALRVRGADRVLDGLKALGSPGGRCWRALPMPERPTGGNAPSWWPTPRARDWKSGSAAQAGRRRSCPLSDAVLARTGGRLEPVFAEWLMGFPPGWTEGDG